MLLCFFLWIALHTMFKGESDRKWKPSRNWKARRFQRRDLVPKISWVSTIVAIFNNLCFSVCVFSTNFGIVVYEQLQNMTQCEFRNVNSNKMTTMIISDDSLPKDKSGQVFWISIFQFHNVTYPSTSSSSSFTSLFEISAKIWNLNLKHYKCVITLVDKFLIGKLFVD